MDFMGFPNSVTTGAAGDSNNRVRSSAGGHSAPQDMGKHSGLGPSGALAEDEDQFDFQPNDGFIKKINSDPPAAVLRQASESVSDAIELMQSYADNLDRLQAKHQDLVSVVRETCRQLLLVHSTMLENPEPSRSLLADSIKRLKGACGDAPYDLDRVFSAPSGGVSSSPGAATRGSDGVMKPDTPKIIDITTVPMMARQQSANSNHGTLPADLLGNSLRRPSALSQALTASLRRPGGATLAAAESAAALMSHEGRRVSASNMAVDSGTWGSSPGSSQLPPGQYSGQGAGGHARHISFDDTLLNGMNRGEAGLAMPLLPALVARPPDFAAIHEGSVQDSPMSDISSSCVTGDEGISASSISLTANLPPAANGVDSGGASTSSAGLLGGAVAEPPPPRVSRFSLPLFKGPPKDRPGSGGGGQGSDAAPGSPKHTPPSEGAESDGGVEPERSSWMAKLTNRLHWKS